jgi:hypothetical protein
MHTPAPRIEFPEAVAAVPDIVALSGLMASSRKHSVGEFSMQFVIFSIPRRFGMV